MDKINVIFLGYAVEPSEASNYSGISIAGNKMQVNILNELNKREDIHLHIITLKPLASYPKDKMFYSRQCRININQGMEATAVAFCNMPIWKQFSQCKNVYRELRKQLRKYGVNNTIVLTFNMFPQIGIPAVKAMRKYGVKTVSLLADLPIDDAGDRRGLSRWLRKHFDESTKNSIKQIKYLIVLNKYAIEKYAPKSKYIVVDGGVTSNSIESYRPKFEYKGSKKNMVYGGSLNKYSGICTFVNAMKYVPDQDICLDIYGSGEGEGYIKEIAKADSRIHFLGRVDNETMLQRQREAFLLINPRPIDNPISKVTFPSKIFEYMLSGTPVISTKLNGFTEEYDNKLFFFKGDDEESMANSIIDILKKDSRELLECAERAYQFVSKERIWIKQVEKICDYFHGIMREF